MGACGVDEHVDGQGTQKAWDKRIVQLSGATSNTTTTSVITTIKTHKDSYTFNAFIDLPDAIASHSPGVECPVFIAIPAICGDHAKFVISLAAVYAITGSEIIRFLTSGRGEFRREPALRGDAAAWV
jgi:hypothetical protein